MSRLDDELTEKQIALIRAWVTEMGDSRPALDRIVFPARYRVVQGVERLYRGMVLTKVELARLRSGRIFGSATSWTRLREEALAFASSVPENHTFADQNELVGVVLSVRPQDVEVLLNVEAAVRETPLLAKHDYSECEVLLSAGLRVSGEHIEEVVNVEDAG